MGRIFQAILLLLLLAALGVVGYAYFGDLSATREEQRIDITLPGAASGN